jgi:hypothetical protein
MEYILSFELLAYGSLHNPPSINKTAETKKLGGLAICASVRI